MKNCITRQEFPWTEAQVAATVLMRFECNGNGTAMHTTYNTYALWSTYLGLVWEYRNIDADADR